MRDAIVSVLTVAVGWVGTNLLVGARQSVRRRSHPVALQPDALAGSTRAHPGYDIVVVALVVASLALPACGGDESGLVVDSPDLREGVPLPERFTCTGDNAVPTIRWTGPPRGAQGWAVVVEDPDAPSGTFTHWVVTGLDRATRSVGPQLPPGAVAGVTSSGQTGYVGPCPPAGEQHRFRYRVHALGEPLTLDPNTAVAEARRRIESVSLDAAEIEVTYRTP